METDCCFHKSCCFEHLLHFWFQLMSEIITYLQLCWQNIEYILPNTSLHIRSEGRN